MRIFFDTEAFRWSKYSGIPRYFSELICEFQTDSNIKIVLPQVYCRNADYQRLMEPLSTRFSWKLRNKIIDTSQSVFGVNPARILSQSEKQNLSYLINDDKYDIFHPTHFSSYYSGKLDRLHKPVVVTAYDLTREKYPEYFSLSINICNDTKYFFQNADRIICISEYTKHDVLSYYDVDPDILDVVYLGPPLLQDRGTMIPDNQVNLSYPQYILFVGMRSGHKNFYHFVEALRPILLDTEYVLVCAGSPFTSDEMTFFKSLSLEKKVVQLSPNNEELLSLYRCAILFVFPSLNEGFGFPVLEAFSCGCPVVCSSTSCFPEIGGDAAVYFDPKDLTSIREAVYRVLTDDNLREKMRDLGYRQLKKFSWKKCAEETKMVYESVLL